MIQKLEDGQSNQKEKLNINCFNYYLKIIKTKNNMDQETFELARFFGIWFLSWVANIFLCGYIAMKIKSNVTIAFVLAFFFGPIAFVLYIYSFLKYKFVNRKKKIKTIVEPQNRNILNNTSQINNKDHFDNLEKLSNLKDKKIITDEEFENKKKEILSRV